MPADQMKKIIPLLTALLFISGCLGMPKSVAPVKDFQLDNYLGQWYEIVRLDHSFERGLQQVTAEYKLQDDGSVSVTNRGFNTNSGKWKQSIGKARFVDQRDEGYLKVSFFGPFYGSYVVFELDKQYRYAFVSGPNLSYLWLLSRQKTVPPEVKQRFIKKSRELGFDTGQLIWVEQN